MKKILIVDDDKGLCFILKKRLEGAGFSVDTVGDGYSLLGYLKTSQPPDIIVLDLILPGRSGMELLSTLKNKWPDVNIFIYSGHPEYKEKSYLFKEYISGFFDKVSDIDSLLDAIKSAG